MILWGDNVKILPRLPSRSADLVIADPLFDVGMAPAVEAECRRILKDSGLMIEVASVISIRDSRGALVEKWLGLRSDRGWPVGYSGQDEHPMPRHGASMIEVGRSTGARFFQWHPLELWMEFFMAKPVSLMRQIVRDFSPAGGRVLVPYCGSGTAAYAAKREGRKFVGIEIDQDRASSARRRLSDLHT